MSPVLDERCSFCNYIEGQGSEIPCKMPGSDFHEKWKLAAKANLALNETM